MISLSPSFASIEEIKSSPNYLIILIPGTGGDDKAFTEDNGNIKKYLEEDIGLKGYVYGYDFPEVAGSNYENAKMLADPSRDDSWFNKAKQKFIVWFRTEGPGSEFDPPRDPLPSEIPQKYILLAHSLGGLTAVTYITSDYYNDDVKKVITIDSPLLGTDGTVYKKTFGSFEHVVGTTTSDAIYAYIFYKMMTSPNPPALSEIQVWGGLLLPLWMAGTQWQFNTLLGDYSMPGIVQTDPEGEFIANLKNAEVKDGTEPISYRLVSARGTPTPDKETIKQLNALKNVPIVGGIYAPFRSSFWKLPTSQQKMLSVAYGVLFGGATFTLDGSFVVPYYSSRGEGVKIFEENTRRFEYIFYNEDLEKFLNEEVPATLAAIIAIHAFTGFNPGLNSLYWIPVAQVITGTVAHLRTDEDQVLYNAFSHGWILQKIQRGSPSIIDQALDDIPFMGGRTSTAETISGISASSIESSTAGYAAAEQAFALLSNLDGDGNQVTDYHTVTIEAYTEGGENRTQLFPIEFDDEKKWVSAITVKEAPTAVKGVINTFLPKKLKYFEYSENFAAWKDVGEVDKWGNFTIKDLNLAEGQNVIAFRAESWTGNKSNQHLKIICNTIPQFVSKPYPAPNSSTLNVHQKIGVEANKASYSGGSSEAISVVSFQVDGDEKLSEANVISSQESHKASARAEWTPTDPLPEGQHDVLVRFQSNVGVSQAIWSFVVDTTAPTVSVATLEPYSARDPTGKELTIKYNTDDNHSAFLNNLSVRLYRGTVPDENSNFVTEITQIATQAAGEHFVNWDGKDANGDYAEDGIYTIRIKAFDQAGNWSSITAQVDVDSTPPQVIEAHVSPNPMPGSSNEFGFAGKISEKSTIILKLTNLSENQTTAYLTQASAPLPPGEGMGVRASYTWRFDDPFMPNLRDGVYELEISARDEAGNESDPYIVSNIKIDRIPPVIFSQYADPFVLANSGNDPYQTVLRYQLSESNDTADNKQSTNDDLTVKIKLYNENSGEMLWLQNAPGLLPSENTFPWNASDPSIGKGSYKFQIIAYDDVGNYSTAYATCVKDGIAPVISYPVDDAEVAGTVTVRGTAMDPDWTNSLGFKEYRVYYRSGDHAAAINPGPGWETSLIAVPEIYRTPGSGLRNASIRAVQNDATLAYFYTDSLADGNYTLLVVAEEDGGAKYASARTVAVSNASAMGSSANPTITLGNIPSAIIFDGDNELPISFTYGGKEINAYVEILKITNSGTRETVYYKYFPGLTAEFYTGQPTYETGNELGYFIWQDEMGWHVRWNGETGNQHRFNGSLVAAGSISEFNSIGDGITQISSIINWDRNMSGGEGGFDFKTDSGQLIISTYLDNDPATPDDDFNTMLVPFFGISKHQPAFSPVIITGLTGQTGSTGKTIDWDGKTDTGAFVDSGDYVVRVRAEGADGTGLTVVEKNLTVDTPFEVTNVSASTSTFNPIGLPDRITVSYNLSKDALIKLKVYQSGNSQPLAIIDDGIQLGKTNPDFPHSISWRGNYPDNNGTQVVTSGDYVLKLAASAADGTETIEKEITPNIRVETLGTSSLVQLDPIGEEVNFNGGTVRAAQGSSDYYWEARADGTYYPPLNYNFTLGVQGQQKASVYPYVPFAGILHRGFRQVDVLVKVKAQFKHRDWWFSWNPFNFGWKEWNGWRDLNKDYSISLNEQNEKAGFTTPQEDFDVSAAKVRVFTFWDSKAGKPIPSIEDARVRVEIYDKSGNFLLDEIENYYTPTGSEVPTDRGIYKITVRKQEFWEVGKAPHPVSGAVGDTWGVSQKGQRMQVAVKLADKIQYSRLTNRFIPWFGFVNKKHSSYEAFSGMTKYLSKLGFPGRDYFTDEAKSIASYKNEIAGEYNSDIFDPNFYKSEGNLVKSILESETSSGTSGDTSAGAQDSYLSGEFIEFIPITEPEEGSFDYLGEIFDREEDIDGDGVNEILLKNRLASYPIEVTTNYRIPYNSNVIDPINLKWPNDWAEIGARNGELLEPLASLLEDPQGYNIENTAYEIDTDELRDLQTGYLDNHPELSLGGGWFKRSGEELSGILRLDKSQIPIRYYKDHEKILGALVAPPQEYVTEYTYSILEKFPSDLTFGYDSHGQNSNITISTSRAGQLWSTSDDPALKDFGGVIRGGPETFNREGFRADGKSEFHYFWEAYKDNYLNYQNYSGSGYNKYIFWSADPLDIYNPDSSKGNLIDNPNLIIDGWQITLKDEADQINQDLEMKDEDVHDEFSNTLDHYFQSKLKYHAKERRLVKLTGRADSDYELIYFNGDKWVKFAEGSPGADGTFTAFWDVGRLCGEHTVLLKTPGYIASQDIYVGDLVYYGIRDEKGENLKVSSAYKRAEVYFQPTSFSDDQFSSVTPVSMSEIYIRNKPIIMTHGPIVELMPSPVTFEADKRPFLKFYYTADDLKEGYDINVSPNDSDWKTKTRELTIHQVTANGDLQVVDDQKKYLETDSVTELPYFAFESALDHFSTYTLLNGRFSLSAPIVYASRYITNQETVTIYGTAEPNSILNVYVSTEAISLLHEMERGGSAEGGDGVRRITADPETGNFTFEDVQLLQEGENYIYVTSHLEGNRDIRTYSDVMVEKDTVPPTLSAKPNLYVFSPNGDGKYDSVDYVVKTNEEGKIYLSVQSLTSNVSGQLINEEISAEPNKEYKINWAENSVRIYCPGTTTNWTQIEDRTLPSTYPDGEYIAAIYAIDEAGNISENIINKTIVDTTPPAIQSLAADPNPFTPNDDGVKDTTAFNYQFSEPAYVTTNIYREDGGLFRKHDGPTENFTYPSSPSGFRRTSPTQSSSGDWSWDGRGSRNELLGGEYAYSIIAEDWVGNSVSSETKIIVVDREPSLVPYAFAEPDPFAPVNPDNSFTEVIYYLSRDNLKVSIGILGNENNYIKTLTYEEVQNKGEHAVRWYGDFDSGYEGPKAAKNQYRVGDGSYQFRVYVEDPDSANPANVTNTVLVDNIPPNIVAGPVLVDYAAKKAALTYNIPENSTVGVGVYDEDDSLIITLVTAEAKSPGDYTIEYDFGQEAAGSGQKYFKIIAIDRAKNTAEKITETFAVDPNPVQITNLSASPNPFTPNGDGLSDLTKITYQISGGVPDYTVSINILTETGSTVKRLIEGETQSGGTYSFYWDGLTDSKQLTADGNYEYVVTVEDKLGTQIEERGAILIVSTRPIVDVSVQPTPYSPNGDGYLDTITFNYSIDYPIAYETGEALVKLEIFASTGEAIWSKIFNHSPGSYAYEWSDHLPSGQYYVKASAEDPFHALAIPRTASFEVDNTSPEVQVDADMIVNPWSFSTNANPDGNDRPRSTTFHYTLVEESKVSVKVHKVPDSQTDYSKSDFTSNNLIKTLVDNVWQAGGVQRAVSWNGSTAGGYADPGKYAFVVETIDRVGNPAEKVWGGTVWIQNNVLTLREPDQQEHAGQNPDPSIISPNGNSSDEVQKRARFYFMIDLSLDPAQTDAPEKIEAAEVIISTEAIGKYSVKVYSDSQLTNLVRTIASEADAQSATLTWEDWGGKDDNGQFVANGTYYIAVDVKDYAGDSANNNLLTRAVEIDNTIPMISNLSVAPYYFSPGSTTSTIKDTTLTYEVSDNSGKSKITIDVYKDSTFVKTLTGEGWRDDGIYDQVWDGSGSSSYVGSANMSGLDDGIYTFKVSAADQAGNSAEIRSKDVTIDTLDPTFGANPESRDWAAADISVEGSVSGSVSGIKTSQYAWSDNFTTPSVGWNDFTSGEVITRSENGEWYLHYKGEDNAGNSAATYFGLYKKDDVPPEGEASPTSRNWATQDIAVTVNASDAHSGLASSKYAWANTAVKPGSGWSDYADNEVLSLGNNGEWYLHLEIEDNVGNAIYKYRGPYKKDNVSPTVGANPESRSWASSNISVTLSVSDIHSGINSSQYAWSGSTTTPGSGWNSFSNGQTKTQSSDGTWYLHLRAEDNVGLTISTYKGLYRKDSVPPIISNLPNKTFNPYVNDNIRVDFTASDASPSSGFSVSNITAKIKYGSNDVKNLTVYDDSDGNYHIVWDGTNNNDDYENEGNYTLEISASDAVGNPATTKTSTITLWDDQYIAQGYDPNIFFDGSLFIRWINGPPDDSQDDPASPAHASESRQGYDSGWGSWVSFNIDHDQEVRLTLSSGGNVGDQAMQWDVDDVAHTSHTLSDLSNPNRVWMTAGTHRIRAYVAHGGAWPGNKYADVYAYFKQRKYNRYARSCSPDYAKNIIDSNIYSQSGPTLVDSYSTGPTSINYGGIIYQVSSDGSDIYFQESGSPGIKIADHTKYAETTFISPAICGDSSGFYVAWRGTSVFGSGIYFQKIPHNFARVTGSFQGASVVGGENIIISQSTTLETPTLVSPDDDSNVTSLRPTFRWKHHKGDTQEYKLDLAKNDTFSIASQTFTKAPNSGSQADPANDPGLYNYTYSIHEFDPGLDRDTYHWKVTAIGTNESATSEVWSFTVAPQLTLTGVTNYPNPFNPNRASTKIRYRLGTNADSVKIRIYDITGSLVKQIDNCPTDGEGSSIWSKYNDVDWNGCNGRGDVVVNGIYPFEIVARLGDRSVSARGKIAVLK